VRKDANKAKNDKHIVTLFLEGDEDSTAAKFLTL
jgi:hypothetical protein